MSHAALPVIRTPRLTLRPLEMTDADALVEGVGNYDVSRWLSVVPYPYSREDAVWFLEKTISEGTLVWGICDSIGLQGVIGLEDEIGYWLARPAWRKGYGFEAAKAVVDHWFSVSDRTVLTSGYFKGNERSAGVLSALGFEIVGESLRDARSLNQEVLSAEMRLTRDRWQSRKDLTLFTPRLVLRPWKEGDAEGFWSLTTPSVNRGTASIPNGWSLNDAKDYLNQRSWQGYPGFMIGIECQSRLIGAVGIGGALLSAMYMLGEEYWGQGFATEAMSAFLPEIFDRFPINRLAADHFDDNPASGRVLQKLGFQQTGHGIGKSKARLEPSPVITYAITRDTLRIWS
ncbi:MAG: GNAT family N-acetyltransferase [Boseongicola sp.]|nr:MAG: GNAT family N-acetyltransferase [Boseongicola sp.]